MYKIVFHKYCLLSLIYFHIKYFCLIISMWEGWVRTRRKKQWQIRLLLWVKIVFILFFYCCSSCSLWYENNLNMKWNQPNCNQVFLIFITLFFHILRNFLFVISWFLSFLYIISLHFNFFFALKAQINLWIVKWKEFQIFYTRCFLVTRHYRFWFLFNYPPSMQATQKISAKQLLYQCVCIP